MDKIAMLLGPLCLAAATGIVVDHFGLPVYKTGEVFLLVWLGGLGFMLKGSPVGSGRSRAV
jgi:hypothetical protein